MTHMVVADDPTWERRFGVLPRWESAADDDFVRELSVPVNDDGLDIQLTWDETDQSVRIRLRSGGRMLLDLFRDEVSLLTLIDDDVVVEYGPANYRGRTVVGIAPGLSIYDAALSR